MAYDEYPPPNWRCSPSSENVANREGHGIMKDMEGQMGNFPNTCLLAFKELLIKD